MFLPSVFSEPSFEEEANCSFTDWVNGDKFLKPLSPQDSGFLGGSLIFSSPGTSIGREFSPTPTIASTIEYDIDSYSPVAHSPYLSGSTTLAPPAIKERTSRHLTPLTVSPASLSPACIEYNLPEAGLFGGHPIAEANISGDEDGQNASALAISPCHEFVEGSSGMPLGGSGPLLVNAPSGLQAARPRPNKRKRDESQPSIDVPSMPSSSRSYPARSATKKTQNYAHDDSDYEEKKPRRQYSGKAPTEKNKKLAIRRNKTCLTREQFEEIRENNPHGSGACVRCDKYLKRSHEWLRHLETHVPQALQCPVCDQPLSRKDAVGRHLRKTCKGRVGDINSSSTSATKASDGDESDYNVDTTRKQVRKKQRRR